MLSSFPRARYPLALLIYGSLAGYLYAQAPSADELSLGYAALGKKDYDTAIDCFNKALSSDGGNAAVHKDLAYTLLKTGENAAARDQFQQALKLNGADETAALEYAYLAYETKQSIEARRTFDRLRKHAGTAATRTAAEQAFQNIDQPLIQGISRWKAALAQSPHPDDLSLYSAHWELAELAEQRDELELAADQYALCRKLKPKKSSLLLDLARVWMQLNRMEDAHAALLAASRTTDGLTAETALESLGSRYPYPYEFLTALQLDPQNVELRRELAFLYLAMDKQADAVAQFRKVLATDPHDQLSQGQLESLERKKAKLPAAPAPPTSAVALSGIINPDARTMGLKSFALGYARDAIKYLQQAHQADPGDAELMLKLGYAYNWVRDDQDAVLWFDRARHTDDPAIAAEATKAYRNLSGDTGPQTTLWALPMYSTRWHDVFTYGQIKRTMPLPWQSVNKWLSLYFSTRFLGDLKSSMTEGVVAPQYLSDSAFIFGAGVSTRTWHHVTGWAEAGESVKYLPFRTDVGAAVPDYRGGLNFAKGWGQLLGSSQRGFYFETTADAIYVSRYDHDWLFNSQNRTGFTFHPFEGSSAQLLWNANYVHDLKNQYWANTIEFGPGVKFHPSWMRPGVYFTTDLLHGVYTNNLGNPRRPNYDDIRIGLWYAFTR